MLSELRQRSRCCEELLFGKLTTSSKWESKQTNTAYEYKHFQPSNHYGDLPLADNHQMELIQILSLRTRMEVPTGKKY